MWVELHSHCSCDVWTVNKSRLGHLAIKMLGTTELNNALSNYATILCSSKRQLVRMVDMAQMLCSSTGDDNELSLSK